MKEAHSHFSAYMRPHNSLPLHAVALPGQVTEQTYKVRDEAILELLAGPQLGDTIELKLLLISAHKGDPNLLAMIHILDSIGIPYDTFIAQEENLTEARLWNMSSAYYQGIILITGNVGQWDDALSRWACEFDEEEWRVLRTFQQRFGIRQVSLFCPPDASLMDFGLEVREFVNTNITPLQLSLTDAGREIFWYLNQSSPIVVRSVAAFLAHARDDSVVPLLVTPAGQIGAALCYNRDGCEQLVLTMAHSVDLIHTQLVGYGLIHWLTHGLFLGRRRVYLSVQVDDVFNSSYLWNAATQEEETGMTYRLTETDIEAAVNWLEQLPRSRRNISSFKLDMAFNGTCAGTVPGTDLLVEKLKCYQDRFRWLNHGFTHLHLDAADVDECMVEIQQNHVIAQQLGLEAYSPANMVTSDTSGLENPQFLLAAQQAGVRYLVSDTSQPGWSNPSPNVGNESKLQPGILVIPRHPTNLIYDVSTPEEWVSRYNHIYHDFWGRNLDIAEIIEEEASAIVRYMLRFDIDPLMFHQANMRAYDGTHSLLSDLIDRVLGKYDDYCANLPVVNLSMHEIGQAMEMRAVYDAAKIEARLILGSELLIVADRDVVVPITGIHIDGASEEYAGEHASTIDLKAGEAYRIPWFVDRM